MGSEISSIGIIGGTGTGPLIRGVWREERRIATADGPVAVFIVRRGAIRFAYLHRHGEGHSIPPHDVRHAANVEAMRVLGVTGLIGINAVGSLHPDLPAGTVLLPHDFIAAQSLPPVVRRLEVRHIDVSMPYCARLRTILAQACSDRGDFRDTGVMAGVVGPRYETPAEVRMLRMLGADVVGMTGVPEAIAAREAGLCYASIACVTNLGVGISEEPPSHGAVASEMERMTAGLVPSLMEAIVASASVSPCTACRATA